MKFEEQSHDTMKETFSEMKKKQLLKHFLKVQKISWEVQTDGKPGDGLYLMHSLAQRGSSQELATHTCSHWLKSGQPSFSPHNLDTVYGQKRCCGSWSARIRKCLRARIRIMFGSGSWNFSYVCNLPLGLCWRIFFFFIILGQKLFVWRASCKEKIRQLQGCKRQHRYKSKPHIPRM
jgi:hypothetical protein